MITCNYLFAENRSFAADDSAVRKRKEIADRLRNGGTVEIEGNNGEMKTSKDAKNVKIQCPFLEF